MVSAVTEYFAKLGQATVEGWNRFWFTPSDPCVWGLIRICTGLLFLWTLFTYTADDLHRLFGPAGYMPLEVVTTLHGQNRFSYFDYLTTPADMYTAHVLAMLVGLSLTVGFFSRISAVLALVSALSYIRRAPLATGEFEPMLALLMFYLCIAPSGASLSVDRLLANRRGTPLTWSFTSTLASRLLQVHLVVVYLMSAMGKFGGEVWWNGAAMWWLLARPETRYVNLTETLLPVYGMVEFWTVVTVWFQLAFAILIWFPLFRPLLLILSVPIWLLLGFAIGQVEFGIVFLIGNLAFVDPAWFRGSCASLCTRGYWHALCPPLTAPKATLSR